jgi:TIR domain-containing protein
MMKTSEPQSVFLSYALADRPQVKARLAGLKSTGTITKNESITDHSKIIMDSSANRNEIRKAIEKASRVIVIWSTSSAESAWVNYETGMADALGKKITIVVPKGSKYQIPDRIPRDEILEAS